MDDVGLELLEHPGQPPGGRQIDLVTRGERDEIGALRHPPIQLSIGVCHERGALPARTQAHHRVHHLALTASPGARSVYVEREHRCSSQSFANFRKTE